MKLAKRELTPDLPIIPRGAKLDHLGGGKLKLNLLYLWGDCSKINIGGGNPVQGAAEY